MFVAGGICGGFGFKHWGYASTIPLAIILVILSLLPLLDDMRLRYRLLRMQH